MGPFCIVNRRFPILQNYDMNDALLILENRLQTLSICQLSRCREPPTILPNGCAVLHNGSHVATCDIMQNGS
eukprot:3914185-Pleurochrysis_carterae.AAC.2